MAQNILNEKIENTLNNIIIPDLEKLLSIEYETDASIIEALNKLEEKWKSLELPQEYISAFNMLVNEKNTLNDILNIMPYTYIYTFTMKLITYLFFKGSKFDTEISLISSLNQICLDEAKDKDMAKYIVEHINYVQDIAMAKDEEKEKLIISALEENVEAFLKHI